MDIPISISNGSGDGGGPDVLNAPLYVHTDVAHLLQVPPRTLSYWVFGKTYRLRHGEEKRSKPLVGDGSGMLSFQDLAELAVVAHLRHLGFVLNKLREAADAIRSETGTPRPFLRQLLVGGAEEIALEVEMGRPISMTHPGQRVLTLPVDDIFKRIEVDQARLTVVRVFPFSRAEQPYDDPALIEINPRRRFGRPITRRSGADVGAIYDRFQWGETIEELMRDIGSEKDEIEEAIRYHARYLKAA